MTSDGGRGRLESVDPSGRPQGRSSRRRARLSDCAAGRDNNFNLIRLTAALAVLFSHSAAVLGLPPDREVLYDRLGLTLADIAVDVFFVTSGFLVTASLINRGSVIAFAWARALRIFPALWVMLILTVFGLAPAMTALSPADYLSSPATRDYFVKCATLITGVRHALPGVFETAPVKGEFNVSLWTLPIELRMYVYLAAGWLVLALWARIRPTAAKALAPLILTALLAMAVSARLSRQPFGNGQLMVLMFVYGVTLYLWRDRIWVDRRVMCLMLGGLALGWLDRTAFFLVYVLCLAPLVLHLAYIPGGAVRQFNRLGDYSYGVYIYAFPIQQTLALVFAGMSLVSMIALSASVTLVFAALSWTLVEKRALALKEDCAAATSRALNLSLTRLAAVVR